MTATFIQIAGSLLAIGGLIWLTKRLGFSRAIHLRSLEEANEMIRLAVGGFDPQKTAILGNGEAAISQDDGGRLALLLPHGGRFVARVVDEQYRLRLDRTKRELQIDAISGRVLSLNYPAADTDWLEQKLSDLEP